MTQDVTVKVPDGFTKEEKDEVMKFSAIQIERIIKRKNDEVDEVAKSANEKDVDDILTAMGLDKKYEKEPAQIEPKEE